MRKRQRHEHVAAFSRGHYKIELPRPPLAQPPLDHLDHDPRPRCHILHSKPWPTRACRSPCSPASGIPERAACLSFPSQSKNGSRHPHQRAELSQPSEKLLLCQCHHQRRNLCQRHHQRLTPSKGALVCPPDHRCTARGDWHPRHHLCCGSLTPTQGATCAFGSQAIGPGKSPS